jgi:hypothetical protein
MRKRRLVINHHSKFQKIKKGIPNTVGSIKLAKRMKGLSITIKEIMIRVYKSIFLREYLANIWIPPLFFSF